MTQKESGEQIPSSRRRLHFREFFGSEHSWRSFGFNHARPHDFAESQWFWVKPWLFVTYRLLLAVGFLVWISCDIPREINNYFHNKTHIWFIYATNWAFGLLTLVFFILAVYCLVYNCPRRPNETPIFYQPLWLMYTIAVDSMIVVSLVFWVALSNSNLSVFSSTWSQLKHSLAACLAILDLLISSIPIRLAHAVYLILVELAYVLFSYLFWFGGGEGPLGVGKVYPGLNWIHPKTAILSCLCTVLFSFLVHIFVYIVYYIRVQLSACLGGRGYADAIEETEKGYGNLGGAEECEIEHEPVSENSMSTCVDEKPSRYYGTVE